MIAPRILPLLPLAAALFSGAFAARAGAGLDLARQLNQAFSEVAEKVSPAVVVITVKEKTPTWTPDKEEGQGEMPDARSRELWRKFHEQFEDTQPAEGQGSGIIVRKDGYILTSHHVVDNSEQIRVRLLDGRTLKATIRGADPQSDLAVLKIEADNLPVARLGDSTKVRVGEFAIAIGAPFSYDYSVTIGHISAKGRSNVIPFFEGGAMMDQDFIQTDAHINPGNSGGPLLNIDGEVIGIITMIRGLSTGIGFAVPGNLAKEISDKIITDGKFTRVWLGIEISAVKDESGEDAEPAVRGIDHGVVVRGIQPDGPVGKSDLRVGDIILAVDGKSVGSAQELRNEVRGKGVGQTVALGVFRDGKRIQVKVKPGEYVESPKPAVSFRIRPGDANLSGLGMSVRALTPELTNRFGVTQNEGVVVMAVDSDGPAARKGIKPGDVISEIDQQATKTPRQFFEALKKADVKKGVSVKVWTRDTARVETLQEGND